MSRHPAQNRNFGRPFSSKTVSPFEAQPAGSYHIEKLLDGAWVCMSCGEIDRDAAPGKEFEKMIRRMHTIGGDCRLIRKRDGVIVFSRKSSRELSAVDAEENEQ